MKSLGSPRVALNTSRNASSRIVWALLLVSAELLWFARAQADVVSDACSMPGQPCTDDHGSMCICQATTCVRSMPCSGSETGGSGRQNTDAGVAGTGGRGNGGSSASCTMSYPCNRCIASCGTGGRNGMGGHPADAGIAGTGGSGGAKKKHSGCSATGGDGNLASVLSSVGLVLLVARRRAAHAG